MPVVIPQSNQHMLVLTTLFLMLLAQPDLGIACLHSVKRLAMSIAVALMHNSDYSGLIHALQGMHCIPEAEV